MNRVYKVIWSKAKHCYVVTSEIAKGYGKSAGSKGVKALLSGLVALSIAMGGYGLADAVVYVDSKVATEGAYTTEVYTTTEADGKFAAKTVEAAVIDVANTVSELGGEYTALDGKVQAEAAAREAGDKTLDDRITAVKDYVLNETGKNYVSKADDAAVQDAGVVKKDKKIGENVTALGKGLYDETAARIGADAAQDKVIQQVNDSLVQSVNTINKNVADGFKDLNTADANEAKARTDADAAEKAARIGADAKLVEAVNSGITLSDDNVLQKNTTTVNADGNVTTKKADVTEMILNKGKDNQITLSEDGIKVGKNSTTMDKNGIYAGSDYDYGTAKAALDATEGKIRGADGNFKVNADGKVTANGGVDTNSGDILTRGGDIKAGSGDISGNNISASGNLHADGDISGKDITGSGMVRGRVVTDGTASMEGGKVQGTSVSDGTATLSGGSLNNAVDINASGTITGKNVVVKDNLTTTNLAVTGGLKTDRITLGSETLNQTDIYQGNVTSKVNDTVSGVEYTAESIFNKDGSSITARTDVGEHADSTGKSIVGAKEISQYLGDAAEPDASQKNVTRSMVRNGDNFSMEDTAVDGDKSSTVSQNAGERKVTVAEGTKNLNVTENLTNGIVSETKGDDGTVTLTQGMDGTYKVETSGNSTEVIGGKKIENYNGGLDTNITGNETHHVTKNQTITVTGKSSLSAADIENKASSSIWNHVGEGYNTSWKMTPGKISESIVNGTASNKENTTAEGTKRIITSEEGTGTYNQTATSNNISLKNKAEDTSFTKSESLKGEKTSVTNPNGSSTINQSAESIVNFVKNSEGTTKTEQSAKDITNTVKNGTITNDANDVLNKGANSVINEVGANQVAVTTKSVEAAYGLDTYTTWDDKGITNNAKDKTVATNAKDILNTATGDMTNTVGGKMLNNVTGDIENTVGGDLINTVTGDSSLSATNIKNKASTSITSQIGEDGKVKSEMNAKGITNTAENGTITNTAQTVKTKTGNNTVTSDNGGTTFKNEDAKTPFEEGDERGTKDNTKITGNKVETGKVLTDFAEVANNLDVKGSTTLGRDGNTTLTVNSESTFRDTVKMDKTLEVDGESTFNNKVTITKNGLDVTGGTTTDTLTVTGTSEFADRADFRKDVYMWGNLEVTGETRTDTLYVDHDGYVGGNLNVDGNIETHDAVLSADSRQVVTGRQLYQTNERVDRLDNRIKKVGANAAALAALRPGDFNPDDKFSIAAGFGSYRNANAAALGLFYRPNENVLLSLGTSFGDGENMVNAGVSVKFGRGKSMAERRKEMADEVSSMRDEMRSQDERIAELEEMLKKQSELIEKLSKES